MATTPIIGLSSSSPPEAAPHPIKRSGNNNEATPPRRSANYHPSVWNDHFLSYASTTLCQESDDRESEEHEELKKQVMRKLEAVPAMSMEELELIDAVQRLGVAYHFESQLEASLRRLYEKWAVDDACNDGDDLHSVALGFRLLRQHGHRHHSDVLKKFTGKDGKFEESLRKDVEGLLSLYEAAHLRVHGEDILEEALDFTTTHLKSIMPSILTNKFLAAKISSSLNSPIHLTMPRLGSRDYISIYREDESHDETLLKFAILDFNILQKIHQRELSDITRWWKSLDFASKLPFARDRIVECYFWILGVLEEPQYWQARRTLTKVIALASVMDDIYDIYGTLDELRLLSQAIQRWDINASTQLPTYLQLFYGALLDVFAELEEEATKQHTLYSIPFAKDGMKQLASAYFQEAIWFHKGYVPTFDEYMRNALTSGGYLMLILTSFACLGRLATIEAFQWLLGEPLIVRATEIICRVTDDMVTYEPEQERGEIASAVKCYMKQYGKTEEEALADLSKQVEDAWKDLRGELLLASVSVARPLLMIMLNFSRMIHLLYCKNGDAYTNSNTSLMKTYIHSLLLNPLSFTDNKEV